METINRWLEKDRGREERRTGVILTGLRAFFSARLREGRRVERGMGGSGKRARSSLRFQVISLNAERGRSFRCLSVVRRHVSSLAYTLLFTL